MQNERKIDLETDDGVRISATHFIGNERSQNLILIAPATGAPQKYYRKFSEFATGNFDFDAITFDYRGIGNSQLYPIKEDTCTMSEWGEQDLKAVIDWADEKYQRIFLLGHSVAGQIFPKASNSERISAAYFVGSQTAYHGHWEGLPWIYVLIFWYILLPLTTRLYGYLPGWTLGGNINIPKQVALEWRKWGKHPQGVLQGKSEMKKSFDRIRIPIHFINIKDDKILAPVGATRELMHYYTNAVTSFQYIRPRDLHIKKLGHFGFFASKHQEKLWSMPILYFTQFVRKLDKSA